MENKNKSEKTIGFIPFKTEAQQLINAKPQYKFITKLLDILKNKKISNIIDWSDNGETIEIRDETKFINEILPKYFKHNNMTNFIRQLNMYNFKKLKHYSKHGVIAYSNSFFKRDKNDLVAEINRKNIQSHHKKDQRAKEISSEENQISTKKMGFLSNKLIELENKVAEISMANSSIANYSSLFAQDNKEKSEYIEQLESLIFFIVNYVLPKKIISNKTEELSNHVKQLPSPCLLIENTDKNNDLNIKFVESKIKLDMQESFDQLKYNLIDNPQQNKELLELYNNASKDYLNCQTISLPETKKILKKMDVDVISNSEKDILEESNLLNKKRSKDDKNIKNCETFFNEILENFKNHCREKHEFKTPIRENDDLQNDKYTSNKPKTTNHNNSFDRKKQESIVSNFELNPIIVSRLSSFNSSTNDKIFTLNSDKINFNGCFKLIVYLCF